MADDLTTTRHRRGDSGNTASCLGCLGTTVLLMVVSGAIVWALNPGMSIEDAAREGILIGGGLSVASLALFCAVPLGLVALVVGLIAFGFIKRKKAVATTIIDAEFDA